MSSPQLKHRSLSLPCFRLHLGHSAKIAISPPLSPLVNPPAGYQGHTFSAALAYPVVLKKIFDGSRFFPKASLKIADNLFDHLNRVFSYS